MAVEIKTVGGARPGAGRPVGSRSPRPRMIADFVAALGGPERVGPLVMLDVERVVDLSMAAKRARAELAAGKVSIDDVVKLENAVGRAMKRLNLPEPSSHAGATLSQLFAAHDAEQEHEKP